MRAALDTPTKKKRQDGERRAQVFDSSEQMSDGTYEAEFLTNGGEDKTYGTHLKADTLPVLPWRKSQIYLKGFTTSQYLSERRPLLNLCIHSTRKNTQVWHRPSQRIGKQSAPVHGEQTAKQAEIKMYTLGNIYHFRRWTHLVHNRMKIHHLSHEKKDLISSSDQEAPRTDERSHSGQSTYPAVEERPHNWPSSRPGSGDTHLASNLDKIIEDPEKSSTQQYNTFVDTRPPEDDHENNSPTVSNNSRESMAAQDEIAFPTTMKSTSTSEPNRERSEDNETDEESLSPADYGLDLGDEV